MPNTNKVIKWQDWYLRSDGKKVHESLWEELRHTVHQMMMEDIRRENQSAINVYFSHCLGLRTPNEHK